MHALLQSRPTALHRYIRGVLTNPNCEYEANYVAIRTLAMWCHTPLPAGTSSDPYDYTHNSSTPSASVGGKWWVQDWCVHKFERREACGVLLMLFNLASRLHSVVVHDLHVKKLLDKMVVLY